MGIKYKLFGVTAISALALASLTACTSSPSSPDQVVTQWFEAVKKGDAEAALKLIPVSGSSEDQSFLTNKALQGAEKITSYEVTPLEKLEDAVSKAEVHASYTTPGVSQPVTLTLEAAKIDGKWTISSGAYKPISIQFGELAEEFDVDGISVKNPVPLTDEAYVKPVGYLALPGTYTVSLPTTNKNVTFASEKVAPGATVNLDNAELSPQAVETLTSGYKALLDKCFATARDSRSFDCPNWYQERSMGTNASEISWQLGEYEFVPVLNGGQVYLDSASLHETLTYKEGTKSFSTQVRKSASISSQKVDEKGQIQITYSFSPQGPEQQSDLNYDTSAKYADRWV